MKICFKCYRTLPLTEFYRHPQMADGHLGKCKECTRTDTAAEMERKANDPKWVESELRRHREKSRRYRDAGRVRKITVEEKREFGQRHAKKYPEKNRARRTFKRAVKAGKIKRQPCSVCGRSDSEGHHENYSKPLEVIWLCPAHHAARHVQIRKELRLNKQHPASP